MKTKEEIAAGLSDHVQKYGEWTYDIPLYHDLWTRGNHKIPHTRLKRLLQIASDLSLKPLAACRILDLGCLDGMFSIEFALQGSTVTGVEIREANIKKAEFVKEILALSNVQFIKDDVRNISASKYGGHDVILCSGILYHLPTPDLFKFAEKLYEIANRLVLIDTHISLSPSATASYNGKTYHGHFYVEHSATDPQNIRESRTLASIDNTTSFWLTRPSLVNLLQHVGFSSVYECFNPPHLNFGITGLEHLDRCTFVAIKGRKSEVHTSPMASNLQEDWPEASLAYAYRARAAAPRHHSLIRRAMSKITSLLSQK
jgi:SAM-dependent methyltransferase